MPRCPSSSPGHRVWAAVAVMAIASAITLASATAPSTASAAAWNNGTVYMHADPIPPNGRCGKPMRVAAGALRRDLLRLRKRP